MRRQKNESWRARAEYICENHENENLDLDRLQKTSEYLYEKSIDFSNKRKQSDIDFADVCCFEFLEFEIFEFLLIDAFWLTVNFEQKVEIFSSHSISEI